QSNGSGYVLHGTPPFVINGSIREPSYTFNGTGVCITSITDSTGCPGVVVNPPIVPGSIPSTGETVCAGGAPATIVGLMPFGGGDGQLAYSWYKDNVLIPGATDANYTPPSTLAPGTYVYTRKVNDRTCGVAPLASTGSWRLIVGEAPATTLTASSPTVCEGAAVTLTATAGAASYSFNGGAWLAGNTTTVTVTATTVYTVKARSAAGCESAEAATTVTANAVPAITLASGSTAQTITAGSSISQIEYTTANASGAIATGLPDGVIGAWASNTYTISGTPSSIGTYSYTVTATTANGCPNDSVRGTITVNITCEPSTITLGTVGFTSTDTYTWNGLMVSSPVTATYCNNRSHTLFNGGSSVTMYYADCAVNAFSGGRGNWFSWCMVKQYADMLCPSPWRVPTPEDWCTLISSWYACPGGDGTNLTLQKGWTYQGAIITAGTAERANSDTWHWTADDNNGASLHTAYAHMDSNNWICMYVVEREPKNRGYSLRCVQDAP
ncbi:MAG: hypothetical protein LBF90_04760, partial [Prevotellaceae bacterium]|nr:hypothetical protein [Prevotellaceae bacterium]